MSKPQSLCGAIARFCAVSAGKMEICAYGNETTKEGEFDEGLDR